MWFSPKPNAMSVKRWSSIVLVHLFFPPVLQARLVIDTFPKKMLSPDDKRNNVLPSPAQPAPPTEKYLFVSKGTITTPLVLAKNTAIPPAQFISQQAVGLIQKKEPTYGKQKETPP
jgi:hypothetical protein